MGERKELPLEFGNVRIFLFFDSTQSYHNEECTPIGSLQPENNKEWTGVHSLQNG